jgi:hypothetical protein
VCVCVYISVMSEGWLSVCVCVCVYRLCQKDGCGSDSLVLEVQGVGLYLCLLMHTYMHTCIHRYIHTCMHQYMQILGAYILSRHTYIHVSMPGLQTRPWAAWSRDVLHTYIHTYIHTCTASDRMGCVVERCSTYIHKYIHKYLHSERYD